jgi:Fic family protein
MPIETLVHYNQALYYKALRDSHDMGLDCRPFIDFMLDMIENSLYKYIDVAVETRETREFPDKMTNPTLDK